ncbi:MAG: DUF1080 domain-containing protein [Fibrobacteria bacterium]|nr:DUF1080 domain-containing protein [Fibrobacteria bacterium]
MKLIKLITAIFLSAAGLVMGELDVSNIPDSAWTILYNGKDFTGWEIKYKGYDLGVNAGSQWKIVDSVIQVDYDSINNDVKDMEMGYLITKKEYSHYLLDLEYMFFGVVAKNAVPWGKENSGIMLHSTPVDSMAFNQVHPISLEMQLNGPESAGNNDNPTHTGNYCSIGTEVIHKGQTGYSGGGCQSSTSAAPPLDTWVQAGALVLGDSLIQHIIQNEVGKEYSKPRILNDPHLGSAAQMYKNAVGSPVVKGAISLQAEGHPVRFRNVRLLNLVGCMDSGYVEYRDYFIKHDSAQCANEVVSTRNVPINKYVSITNRIVSITEQGQHTISVMDVYGREVHHISGFGSHTYELPNTEIPGIYFVKVKTLEGTLVQKVLFL